MLFAKTDVITLESDVLPWKLAVPVILIFAVPVILPAVTEPKFAETDDKVPTFNFDASIEPEAILTADKVPAFICDAFNVPPAIQFPDDVSLNHMTDVAEFQYIFPGVEVFGFVTPCVYVEPGGRLST
ncbi:hypothetical protein W03_10020 [Nitrosomonas sp. PY1]|nr:hypothetical protein W03_10020 [Nitrosomonas sp. PY1]